MESTFTWVMAKTKAFRDFTNSHDKTFQKNLETVEFK